MHQLLIYYLSSKILYALVQIMLAQKHHCKFGKRYDMGTWEIWEISTTAIFFAAVGIKVLKISHKDSGRIVNQDKNNKWAQ